MKSHIYDAYNDKNLEKEETEIKDLVHKFGFIGLMKLNGKHYEGAESDPIVSTFNNVSIANNWGKDIIENYKCCSLW